MSRPVPAARAAAARPAHALATLVAPAVLVALLAASVTPAGPAGADPSPTVDYAPPVAGEVVRAFDRPDSPYGPGNRGVDYRTAVGAPVVAAADGEVVFAGLVAGTRHVTLLHADGLRSSYSFLATVETRVGARLHQGQTLGTSTGHLHFGIRRGDEYVDPAAVLRGDVRVHLVAVPPERVGVDAEGLALLGAALDGLSDGRLATLRHYSTELLPATRELRIAREVADRRDDPCTPIDDRPDRPDGRRIAVLVGGLGTTSERASIERLDTAALGYASTDVVRFSYRGGRTPAASAAGSLGALPSTTYAAADSQGDLLEAAARLRGLLAAVEGLEPGVPIDVYAHSQGGVVTQLAISDLVAGPAVPASLDFVATMGSPHSGTDLATAVTAIEREATGAVFLDGLGGALGIDLDPGAPAAAQLSETSALVADLHAAVPPEGVRLLSIGARGDLTVPAGHTRLWDAPNAVVDLAGTEAHTRLPGASATTRELALGLAGAPPTCRSVADHLHDTVTAEGISWAEDLLGATIWRMTA